MNVLLTPIGRRGYLARWFREALAGRGQVITADASMTAAGSLDGDFHISLPPCDSTEYPDAIVDVCKQYSVRLVVPLHDLEAYLLGTLPLAFAGETQVLTLFGRAAECAWDKAQTEEIARAAGLRYPNPQVEYEEAPVVVKPRFGSASRNAAVLSPGSTQFQLHMETLSNDGVPHLVQEFVSGTEYGLDVVGHLDGTFAGCLVREKLRMRAGETDAARIHPGSLLEDVARQIHKFTGHAGLIDCDLICSNGSWYLIDVNPRFGGGYPLSHAAGASVPELLVQEAIGAERPLAFAVRTGATVAKQDEPRVVRLDAYTVTEPVQP